MQYRFIEFVCSAGRIDCSLELTPSIFRGAAGILCQTATLGRIAYSADLQFLASPVTRGGIAVGRFQQLFLLALSEGKKQPREWAEFVRRILDGQGQRILKDGKALESAEDDIAELTTQAQTFAEKQLPVLRQLGIA